MVFNSIEFLIFFPVVLFLYFVLPQKLRWILLLSASYYFYVSWNLSLIWLILFTTAVSYLSAILIGNLKEKYPNGEKRGRERFWLILTLLVSLGVLFFFKYFNFLSDSVNAIANLFRAEQADPLVLNLILPVGISFYTFQTLSYVIDIYRGSIKPERHFGYYALYVSFFPQLVAGPIERPENLIPQLHEKHRFEWSNAIPGLRKMLIGFFKKVVVADLLATYVNAVYNAPSEATGFGVLLATVLFAFQIYCDFAGYTDIAIGCAEVMGIRLMQNFDRPYISESIQEFWRRWHISLSSWFKDYIYFPLGGSRCKKWRHMLNICIVFFVSGLWHGAAWTFVIWGLLHGIYQVIGHFTKKPREKMWRALHVDPSCKAVRLLKRFNTFLLVSFAWIFFRANSFSDLLILLKKLFTDWSLEASYFAGTLDHMELTVIGIVTSVLSILVMNRMDLHRLGAPTLSDGRVRVQSASRYVLIVWTVVLAWLLLLMGDGASSFIYFQF